jgi:hypothetical protein
MKFLGAFFIFFSTTSAWAEFGFNANLAKGDRVLILRTLGLGTLSKNLSQPRPLGTNSGVEIGVITEMINTKEIKPFLIDSRNSDVLYYPKLLVGKGLYERVDFFFHFIPFTSTLGVSEFGGMLRYNFFQTNSPFLASALIHANSANFNNQLTTRNVGADLSLGLAWDGFSVFTGFGWGRSKGTFVGGTTGGITDSLNSETEVAQSSHISLGASVKSDIYTFAFSVDHYVDYVYAVKFGVLF